jgi:hypothetical protein
VLNFPGMQPVQCIADVAAEVGTDVIVVGTPRTPAGRRSLRRQRGQRLLEVAPSVPGACCRARGCRARTERDAPDRGGVCRGTVGVLRASLGAPSVFGSSLKVICGPVRMSIEFADGSLGFRDTPLIESE